MTGFSRLRFWWAPMTLVVFAWAAVSVSADSGSGVDEVGAKAVSTFHSGVLDVGAGGSELSWLAGDSGAIRLWSPEVAGFGGHVAWALFDGPEWLRIDSDGLLHFSVPLEASRGSFVAAVFDADGAALGEYSIEYAAHEGQVVAAATVSNAGGEIWHPDGLFGVRFPASVQGAETEVTFVRFGSDPDGSATRLRLSPGTGAMRKPGVIIFPAESDRPEVASAGAPASGLSACDGILSATFIESLAEDGWRIRLCRPALFIEAFFSLIPGFDISTALNRVPDERREFPLKDVFADRFEIVRQPAAVLASMCGPGPGNTSCDNRTPVLLVHGLSVGGGFGGGRQTWNDLAGLLQAYDAGDTRFAVYEFFYRSNARFVDVARDLGIAIRQIHAETGGRKVRIIAHSFGGLVARAGLQGLAEPPVWPTPPADCAASHHPYVDRLLTIGTPHSGISDSIIERHGLALPVGRDGLAGSTISICRQVSCWEAGAAEARGLAGGLFPEVWSELYGVSDAPGEIIARLAGFDSAPLGVPVRAVLSLVSGERTVAGLFEPVSGSDVYLDGDGLISYQGQRFSPELSCSDGSCRNEPIEQDFASPASRRQSAHCVEEKVLGAGGFAFPFPGAPVPAVGRLIRDYKHSRFIPQSASAIQPSISAHSDLPALGADRGGVWASTHDAMNQILDWLVPGEVVSVLEVIVHGAGSVQIETQPNPVLCQGYCLVPVTGSSVTLLPISASAAETAMVSENCQMLDARRCRVTFTGWGSTLVRFANGHRYMPGIEPGPLDPLPGRARSVPDG